MPIQGPPTQREHYLIENQKDYLSKLIESGTLTIKSGNLNTLMDQWVEVNLPRISESSQSEEHGLLPANNPQPLIG